MNYAISKYRFADTRLWCYDPDGLQRQRVLANLLSEDSLNKFPLIITDLKNNAECSHRHLYTPERGITIIQLANKQIEPTNEDFWDDFYNPQRDYLIVVIVSNEDNTCFYVEENQHVFGSTKEVIKMLIKSINKGLSNKWLRIEQEGEIITSKDNLAVVCVSAYVTAMLRQIMKERKIKQELTPPPKKKNAVKQRKSLREAVIDQSKADKILQKIGDCIKGKTDPIDFMMPITAAIAALVINAPSLTQLCNSHPEIKITSATFYRLRNPELKKYSTNDAFNNLVAEFKSI